MLRLLESGKDIVTANKALLAEHGAELFDRARELGRTIAFEAAVAGGVPIITNISQCLSANQILSLRGILNGTSNFIISQMEEQGTDYAAAVAQAQERGFAEADPTMDVDGTDAAQKLAILAHLAFGAQVDWAQIPRIGIDRLDPTDLRWAQELGYRIKLLAIARLLPDAPGPGGPCVADAGPHGHAVGRGPRGEQRDQRRRRHGRPRLLPGARSRPTADRVGGGRGPDRYRRRTAGLTFRTLEWFSRGTTRTVLGGPSAGRGPILSPASRSRITPASSPRSPASWDTIPSRLPRSSNAASSTTSEETVASREDVMLVIMTHLAKEGRADAALAEIDQLPSVRPGSVRMRVLD